MKVITDFAININNLGYNLFRNLNTTLNIYGMWGSSAGNIAGVFYFIKRIFNLVKIQTWPKVWAFFSYHKIKLMSHAFSNIENLTQQNTFLHLQLWNWKKLWVFLRTSFCLMLVYFRAKEVAIILKTMIFLFWLVFLNENLLYSQ